MLDHRVPVAMAGWLGIQPDRSRSDVTIAGVVQCGVSIKIVHDTLRQLLRPLADEEIVLIHGSMKVLLGEDQPGRTATMGGSNETPVLPEDVEIVLAWIAHEQGRDKQFIRLDGTCKMLQNGRVVPPVTQPVTGRSGENEPVVAVTQTVIETFAEAGPCADQGADARQFLETHAEAMQHVHARWRRQIR